VFARPQKIEEAVSMLHDSAWTIVAGGTDFYPGLRDRAISSPVMDISAISALKSIGPENGGWRIGALVTWSDLIKCELPAAFGALKLAAREVGSVQIQNRATIAGNLCNASPAADGVPPLLILDAAVELTSVSGKRMLALADFIQGNRKTSRRPDELLTSIVIPASATTGSSHFLKLGVRKYLVISIAMVAARLSIAADGTICEAAISVGSCSEVAQRLTALEQDLINRDAATDFRTMIAPGHLDDLAPIDDIRASKEYRLKAAHELVCRALEHCQQPVREAA
jgi:CO/xanthine dehydrogenase FAD-binding subunit